MSLFQLIISIKHRLLVCNGDSVTEIVYCAIIVYHLRNSTDEVNAKFRLLTSDESFNFLVLEDMDGESFIGLFGDRIRGLVGGHFSGNDLQDSNLGYMKPCTSSTFSFLNYSVLHADRTVIRFLRAQKIYLASIGTDADDAWT